MTKFIYFISRLLGKILRGFYFLPLSPAACVSFFFFLEPAVGLKFTLARGEEKSPQWVVLIFASLQATAKRVQEFVFPLDSTRESESAQRRMDKPVSKYRLLFG